ncbi:MULTISPECIES: GntR family transcriptional regulator [Thermoactinomyces]|uniref:GntR family transcriptional regulator n=1 Tax=Thermoactinomyces TaxID=2023 RepID=UPI0005070BFA|nr:MULTISPECIES: GntR family transcriptional regulator [Thermoactinomyces]KFZ40191.1 GntR family transcriptional regulator [Thermoactinomyces sp. Gus2-1]MBH8584754.1 GntR family transcriptional regulator [Thermoactinomyces sp. CICC 10520]MBI0391209.1 GntR family transcriptional regulator [Thermoactinomyces sp. CICC 24226]MCF6134474.1 GntR family transcriptional regulator [Thermoactinomyces vulgaris]QBK14121.1 GntR family transcriptional regulator [Thermoactinomyces vulgaris]
MSRKLDSRKPIFLQIREKIEDMIVNEQLKEDEQAPSTTQLVNFYKINHATVSKGVNQLVEEGILYKKRGIGMFVAKGAREKLIQKRKKAFVDEFVVPLVQEAHKLGITESEVFALIKKEREGMKNEL